MKNYTITQLVLLLTPFVFSFAFGLDIYIPILPQMVEIFNASPFLVHLTMSLFLFFTGAGQLVIGPLADRFGRKPLFYFSSVAFAIGALGCALSTHIFELISCRVVTAIGACGMLVTSFALVRDLYSGEENAKVYSFLNGAIGISPTFAPILGGYLAVTFGWQSIFFFLCLLGVLAYLISYVFIAETYHLRLSTSDVLKKQSISALQVWINYKQVFFNKPFLIYAMIAGLSESIFFCFFSISPFILIGLHKIPTNEFGYYFAIFGSVISLGGFASGKLISALGIRRTLFVGISMMLIGGALMFAWCSLIEMSLWGFLIPMAISCLGAMLMVGGTASMALEPFEKIAGTASAAFGFFEFSLSALVGSLLMMFPTTTILYALFIIVLGLLSLGLLLLVSAKNQASA